MKLIGIELANFRSIGENSVVLNPLRKCNIIIGQNNTGKSNVLRAVKKISDKYRGNSNHVIFENVDFHSRKDDQIFKYRLWFEAEPIQSEDDKIIAEIAKTNIYWFDLVWQGKAQDIVDFSFANIAEFKQANALLRHLTGHRWSQQVQQKAVHDEFIRLSTAIFTRFSEKIPPAFLIPEFRQIRQGDNYSNDGEGLIKLLAEYQAPPIGRDTDHQKFEKVQSFVRQLLHLPEATLEFPRGEAIATFVIKNKGLRLPLSSFGTGVHEVIIMITAVLSRENALWCIEEPEIHLHPRLQREFIEFLIHETSNQYLITTHSPTLINSLVTNPNVSVFHLQNQNGVTIGGPILSESGSSRVIRDLGLKPSDLLQANCILWVEGLTDRVYIQKWIELVSPDLVEGRDYAFMFYSSLPKLNFETDISSDKLLNIMKFNSNAIVVIDSDTNKVGDPISKEKNTMRVQCEGNGGLSWVTDGREIENYLTAETVKKGCKDLRGVEIDIKIGLFDEFSKVIDKALKAIGANAIDYSHAKLNFSRKFSEHITLDDINTPLKENIELLVAKIKEWNA